MPKEDFREFSNRVLKRGSKAKHKIDNAGTAYPAYKWIRKNKWLNIGRPLTEHEFYSIVRMVNLMFVGEFLKGHPIKFPLRMGTIELRKLNVEAKFDKEGKLKVPKSIDWNETIKLWHEDEEAYNNRVLIKRDTDWRYIMVWQKKDRIFRNKEFYEFTPNRWFRNEMLRKVEEKELDTIIEKY